MIVDNDAEKRSFDLLIEAIRKCRDYQPRFGGKHPLSLQEFQQLYQADDF